MRLPPLQANLVLVFSTRPPYEFPRAQVPLIPRGFLGTQEPGRKVGPRLFLCARHGGFKRECDQTLVWVRDVTHRRLVTRAVQSMMVEILVARMQHVASFTSCNDMASNASSDSLLVSSSSSSESTSDDSYSSSSSSSSVQHALALHSGIDHPT